MKKLLSLLLGACSVFAACTNDNDNLATDDTQALGVKVIVNPTSRTMVTGTSLPDGHSIGVNVTMPDGANYDNKDEGYLNMKYTATGNMPGQTWEATPAIMLSGTQGVACAYYPWTDGTDYKAIQIKAEDQIDWMWAADAADYKVSDADNEVNFVFNHAQTAVNVVVTRAESYTGAGVVADLAVESDGLASAATLDASTGTFVDGSVTGAGTAIAIAQQFTLTADNAETTDVQEDMKENPFMLVPVEGQTEAFTISATIDGKPYSVAAVMAQDFAGYEAGKVYKIKVTISNIGLKVTGVAVVNDWQDIPLGDGQMTPAQ